MITKRTLWRAALSALTAVTLATGLVGCGDNEKKKPAVKGDHPKGEHPKKTEHPEKSEHPEHPK
jgi:hypothetical protein